MARRQLSARFWTKVGAIAAIAAVVVAVVLWGVDKRSTGSGAARINATTTGNNNNVNVCVDHSSCPTPIPSPTPAVVPRPTPTPPAAVPIDASGECPAPDSTVPVPPKLTICVLFWCHSPIYDPDGRIDETQYQIKLRPLISNYGDSPVRISVGRPSAIRLLIQGAAVPTRWRPGPVTRNYGDRPIKVNYQGGQFWAIPPNRPGTETPVYSIGQYTGFATTWDYGPMLAAHQSAGSVRPAHDVEDLVFNVPLASIRADEPVVNVLGLAVVEYVGRTPRVVALAQVNSWQRQEEPSQF